MRREAAVGGGGVPQSHRGIRGDPRAYVCSSPVTFAEALGIAKYSAGNLEMPCAAGRKCTVKTSPIDLVLGTIHRRLVIR